MADHVYHKTMTLEQVQELLTERVRNSKNGSCCPACLETARIDRRRLTKDMVKSLVRLACLDLAEHKAYHISEFAGTASRDFNKVMRWGLAELAVNGEGTEVRGFWWLTDLGREFVNRRVAVTRATFTYRGNVVSAPPWASESDLDEVIIDNVYPMYSPEEHLKPVTNWETRDKAETPTIIEAEVIDIEVHK